MHLFIISCILNISLQSGGGFPGSATTTACPLTSPSLIPCPYLRGLVDNANVTAIFRPNEVNGDYCAVQNFCQDKADGFYCFLSQNQDKCSQQQQQQQDCWPSVMVQCPDDWLIRCRPGFACQERGGPWIDGTIDPDVPDYLPNDWREAKCRALDPNNVITPVNCNQTSSFLSATLNQSSMATSTSCVYNTCKGPNPWIESSACCTTTTPMAKNIPISIRYPYPQYSYPTYSNPAASSSAYPYPQYSGPSYMGPSSYPQYSGPPYMGSSSSYPQYSYPTYTGPPYPGPQASYPPQPFKSSSYNAIPPDAYTTTIYYSQDI